MGSAYFLVVLLSLLLCPPVWAGDSVNPETGRLDLTGVDVITTDCSAQTAEGRVCWDSDDDTLYVGDGTTANTVSGGIGDVTAVGDCTTGACFGGASGDTLTPASGTLTLVGDVVSSNASPSYLLDPTSGTTAGLHMDPGGVWWLGNANGQKSIIFQTDGDMEWPTLTSCAVITTDVNGLPRCGLITDLTCTDCLNATEIEDIYLLNSGDTTTGNLAFNDGSGESPRARFDPETGVSWQLFAQDSDDDFQIIANNSSAQEGVIIWNNGAGTVRLQVEGDLLVGDGSEQSPSIVWNGGDDQFHMGLDPTTSVFLFSNATDGAHLLVVDRQNKFEFPQYIVDCTGGRVLTVDGGGKLRCIAVAGSGTVTSVDSGNGLTGGPITSSGTLAVGDGTGITVSADALAFASTEIEATTWGAGGNASNAFTFNLSGTDPVLTAGSDAFTFDAATITVQGPAPNVLLAPDSGTAFGWHVDPGGAVSWFGQSSTHFLRMLTSGAIEFPGLPNCTTLGTGPNGRAMCGPSVTPWDVIGDATANGSIGFNATQQILSGNTPDSTGAQDMLSLNYTNDASNDGSTQRVLVVNINDATGNGVVEDAIAVDLKDTNMTMPRALRLHASSTGVITTALDVSDAEIVTALSAGANDLSGTAWSLTGSSGDLAIHDLTMTGTNTNLTIQTTGSDAFGIHTEAGSLFYINNETDGNRYFMVDAAHNTYLPQVAGCSYGVSTDSQGKLMCRSGITPRCASVENLAAADDDMSLGSWDRPVTITTTWCHYKGTGTTLAHFALEDGGGTAMTHARPNCKADGTDAEGRPVTANNTLNAFEKLRFDTTNSVSPETDEYDVCVGGFYTN